MGNCSMISYRFPPRVASWVVFNNSFGNSSENSSCEFSKESSNFFFLLRIVIKLFSQHSFRKFFDALKHSTKNLCLGDWPRITSESLPKIFLGILPRILSGILLKILLIVFKEFVDNPFKILQEISARISSSISAIITVKIVNDLLRNSPSIHLGAISRSLLNQFHSWFLFKRRIFNSPQGLRTYFFSWILSRILRTRFREFSKDNTSTLFYVHRPFIKVMNKLNLFFLFCTILPILKMFQKT